MNTHFKLYNSNSVHSTRGKHGTGKYLMYELSFIFNLLFMRHKHITVLGSQSLFYEILVSRTLGDSFWFCLNPYPCYSHSMRVKSLHWYEKHAESIFLFNQRTLAGSRFLIKTCFFFWILWLIIQYPLKTRFSLDQL